MLAPEGFMACIIETLEEAPMRLAPAAIILKASSRVRIPPDAFTPPHASRDTGEKIVADIAGVRIELPKTKEGVKLMKQILELIEGGL